jgi:hypothetical protein
MVCSSFMSTVMTHDTTLQQLPNKNGFVSTKIQSFPFLQCIRRIVVEILPVNALFETSVPGL